MSSWPSATDSRMPVSWSSTREAGPFAKTRASCSRPPARLGRELHPGSRVRTIARIGEHSRRGCLAEEDQGRRGLRRRRSPIRTTKCCKRLEVNSTRHIPLELELQPDGGLNLLVQRNTQSAGRQREGVRAKAKKHPRFSSRVLLKKTLKRWRRQSLSAQFAPKQSESGKSRAKQQHGGPAIGNRLGRK